MKAKMAADEGTVSALMEHSTLCCSAGVDYCLMICFVLVRLRACGMHQLSDRLWLVLNYALGAFLLSPWTSFFLPALP